MPTTHPIPLHHTSRHLVEELNILETARDEVVTQELIVWPEDARPDLERFAFSCSY